MKVLLLILMLVLLTATVSAALVPVDVDVSVDFSGERDFMIILPNGFERHFFWEENQTHTDSVYEHTIYWDLDEDIYCTDTNKFKNVTEGMVEMLDVCKESVLSNNQTAQFYELLNAARLNSTEYQAQFNTSQSLLDVCKPDLTTCKNDLSEKQRQITRLEQTESNTVSCTTQLDSCNSGKNTMMIGGFIVGLAIGYFMWGRKKGRGPSEQAERGDYSDSPSNRFIDTDAPPR